MEINNQPDQPDQENHEDDLLTTEPPVGGRRHRGSKKRHGNASLRAWVTFVKKVQREEKVSYKEAMMRAKKRKDHGEKWRGGSDMGAMDDPTTPGYEEKEQMGSTVPVGGRRRRRTHKRRGSKRHTRRHRKSRRHR